MCGPVMKEWSANKVLPIKDLDYIIDKVDMVIAGLIINNGDRVTLKNAEEVRALLVEERDE